MQVASTSTPAAWLQRTLEAGVVPPSSLSPAAQGRASVRAEDAVCWKTRFRLIRTRQRSAVVVNAVNHHIDATCHGTLSRAGHEGAWFPPVTCRVSRDAIESYVRMRLSVLRSRDEPAPGGMGESLMW